MPPRPSFPAPLLELDVVKAALKEVMAITAVQDGKDAPDGYEIVLETADKKVVEVTVAPDGKVLEDSGQKK